MAMWPTIHLMCTKCNDHFTSPIEAPALNRQACARIFEQIKETARTAQCRCSPEIIIENRIVVCTNPNNRDNSTNKLYYDLNEKPVQLTDYVNGDNKHAAAPAEPETTS